jgi:hypothetical protein
MRYHHDAYNTKATSHQSSIPETLSKRHPHFSVPDYQSTLAKAVSQTNLHEFFINFSLGRMYMVLHRIYPYWELKPFFDVCHVPLKLTCTACDDSYVTRNLIQLCHITHVCAAYVDAQPRKSACGLRVLLLT